MDNNIYTKGGYIDYNAKYCDTDSSDYTNKNTISSRLNNIFMNRVFYSLKNNSYEVYIMYSLLIITLIIMLALAFDSAEDYYETDRFIKGLKRNH